MHFLSNQSPLQIIYWSLSCHSFLFPTDPPLTSWMFQSPSMTRCKNLQNQTDIIIICCAFSSLCSLLCLFASSFDTNHVHLAGTSGQNQPGQHGQHIYTEYQNLGPNNGLHVPYGGPKEGQRPTLREPLVYIPAAGPDGNRIPLVKVCEM